MIYEAFLIKSWSSFNTFTVLSGYLILHNRAQIRAQKYSSWTCCCSSAGSRAQKWEKLLLCSRLSCRFPEYLPAFQPLQSFHVAVGGRKVGGAGKEPFCGLPQLWRNLRSYHLTAASNNGKSTGLWVSCKPLHERKITSLHHFSQKPAISIFPQSWNNEFMYQLLNPSSLYSLEGKVPLSLRH